MADLPDGFTIDQPQADNLPAGFTIDQPAPTRSTMGDVGIEGGKGLARGAESAAGDVGEAVMGPFGPSHHFANLMHDLGIGPKPAPEAGYGQQLSQATGMQATPQTEGGKFAGTIGEFVGNPETYLGPGGMARKAAMGAASGAGSEAAGELTEGTPLEPAARILGAAAAGLPFSAGRTAAGVAAPTVEDLHDSAEGHYNAMHGFGVELHPDVMDNVATNITTELKTAGYRPIIAPKTFSVIEELRNPDGPYTTTQEVEAVRRALGKVSMDPAERDAARRAIGQIDDRMASLQPVDAAINPQFAPRVSQEAVQARGDYAAMKQAEQVETAQTNAELQAASTGSGANVDNATRQKIRSILTSPSKRRGYSQADLDSMDQIVRGTFVGNAARLLGKLAPTGIVSGGLSATLGHLAGHTIGVPALGYVAKKGADAMTRRGVAQLGEQVRLDSPQARRIGAAASTPGTLPITALQNQFNPYSESNQ